MRSFDVGILDGKTGDSLLLNPSALRQTHGNLEFRVTQGTWQKMRRISVRIRNIGTEPAFCELRVFAPKPIAKGALYWDGYCERRWTGKRMHATNATPSDGAPVKLVDHIYPEVYKSLNPSERRFNVAMRREFAKESQFFVFPAAAVWTPFELSAIGVDPRQELAYQSSGVDDCGRLFSAVKRVVLSGEELETVFVGFRSRSHQGHRTVLQTYYDSFPSIYHFRPELSPSLIGPGATIKAYDLPEAAPVLEEDFRRFGVCWTWDIGEIAHGMMVYEKEEDLDPLRSRFCEPFRSASRKEITSWMRRTNETLRQFCTPCYGLTFEHASTKLVERHQLHDAVWVRNDGTPHIRHFHEECQLVFANETSYFRYLERQIQKSLKLLKHSGFIFDNAGGTRMYFGPAAYATQSRAFVNGRVYSTSGISHVGLMRAMQALRNDAGEACPVAANTPADFNLARHTDIAILEGGPWIHYRDWPRLLRQMMGCKPVLFWGPKSFPGWLDETGESLPPKIDKVVQELSLYCLALGILPNASHSVRGFPRMRALLPVLQQLARAGWRPERKSVRKQGRATVEEYGQQMITVTNFSGVRDRTVLQVPGSWNTAVPLLDGSINVRQEKGGLRLTLELPARSAQVLNLLPGTRASSLEWVREGEKLHVRGLTGRVDLSRLEGISAGIIAGHPRPRRYISADASITLLSGSIWDRLGDPAWLSEWVDQSGPPLISIVGLDKSLGRTEARLRLYLAYWQASREEEMSTPAERLKFSGGDHDTKFLLRIGERVTEKLKLKDGPSWTIHFRKKLLKGLPSGLRWVLESERPGEFCLLGAEDFPVNALLAAWDRHFPLSGVRAMEERRHMKAKAHLLHVEA